jgi:hypothetical protein
MLFGPLFKQIVSEHMENPVSIGWSPITSAHLFSNKFLGTDKFMSTDMSYWDWSVQLWLVEINKLVLKLIHVDKPDFWIKLVDARFKELFENAQFEFQDGTIIQQMIPGIMKSGCYLTLVMNSLSQVILDTLVRNRYDLPYEMMWAQGDDVICERSQHAPQLLEGLKSLGFEVKVAEHDTPEFCGFFIENHKHIPSYMSKHQFKLQHLTLDPEVATSTLRSAQLVYSQCPEELGSIRAFARKIGLPGAIVSDYLLSQITNH